MAGESFAAIPESVVRPVIKKRVTASAIAPPTIQAA